MAAGKDDHTDDPIPRSVTRRGRSRPDRGSYSLARFVIACGIALLWGAVNARYFFGHGPAVPTEFNAISGVAVGYLLGFDKTVRRIRGKDDEK